MNGTNKTELGIGSYCYPFALGTIKNHCPSNPMTLKGLIDKACTFDVHVVQIADNVQLFEMTDTELNRLASYATQKNITLEIGLRGILPERLSTYINICCRLNAKLLRCVIDSPGHTPSLQEIHGIFSSILPVLEKNGVTLGIENHDRFSTDVFAQIVKDCDSPHIGIVLDTTNSISQEETSMQALHNLAKYTVNFHVKDYTIDRRKDAMGFVVKGTPAGQGRLDIPLMLAVLKHKAKMNFSTILEFWMEPEADIPSTIEKEGRWVVESISYLKQIIN